MNRYVNHRFTNMYRATVGTDFLSKTINIDGDTVTLQVIHLCTCAFGSETSPHTPRNKTFMSYRMINLMFPTVCMSDLGHSRHREVPVSGYTSVQGSSLLHAGV